MTALADALVQAQAELPIALRRDANGEIGGRGYKYLTLDKLIEATRPILNKHGLAIIQEPMATERGEAGFVPMLRTTLIHAESGQVQSNQMPLYLTDKTMQTYGAAITYARRYAWQSLLGIAAEEDTDAKDEIPF